MGAEEHIWALEGFLTGECRKLIMTSLMICTPHQIPWLIISAKIRLAGHVANAVDTIPA